MSGYYGVRRAFLSDPDFHNTKQFANDACTSSAAKPFACESSAGQGHAALLDPYFPEPYGDHRPTALTPNSGTLFSASALPPLLPPPFPSDPAHFALVSTQRLSLGEVTEVGVPAALDSPCAQQPRVYSPREKPESTFREPSSGLRASHAGGGSVYPGVEAGRLNRTGRTAIVLTL